MNYAQDKYTVEYKNRSKGEMIKTPDTEHNAHQRQLRIDTFACAAMGGLLPDADVYATAQIIAERAYHVAEAMEYERSKRIK